MIISQSIIDLLDKNINNYPPETGGILGSNNGKTINQIVFDKPKPSKRPCSYSPNTEMFNKVIEDWEKHNIKFCGIFHTHFANIGTLSAGDREYIKVILSAMPKRIDKLFFPIYLLPKRSLIPYSAWLEDGKLCIEATLLNIV